MPGGGIDLEGGLRSHSQLGLDLAGESATRLGYIAGVVSRSRLVAFERVIFRATRGNMYLRHADIAQQVRDPHSGELVHKSVFIIFFSGRRSLAKVMAICDTFGANRYNYPAQFGARTALLTEVQTRIDELQKVIDHASRHRADRLAELARMLPRWRDVELKQKAVYRVLNMWNYDLTRKCLIAEAWCPVSSYEETQAAVRRGGQRAGAQVPPIINVIDTDEKPPTYFRQNKFTAGFQVWGRRISGPRASSLRACVGAAVLSLPRVPAARARAPRRRSSMATACRGAARSTRRHSRSSRTRSFLA